MNSDDQAYIKLQQHLDRQAVGFPAARNRSEIKLLRHIFTPDEAEIATCLSYRPETLEAVYLRARHLVASPDELARRLAAILKKGGIEIRREDGHLRYCNAPLVVGMYELQTERLTPEFIQDFKEYTSDIRFGIEFLGTALPQMRTIPIARSLRPQHQASSFDEVTQLLREAHGPFVVVPCICRRKKRIDGHPCRMTQRRETCLGLGSIAETVLLSGAGREIDRAEALAVIESNQNDGLILQPSNTETAAFICSCCGCCCGMLRIHHSLPKPVDFWASNYFVRVDAARCNGCGICTRRCQVRALKVPARKKPARVDLNRCLGCGHCVAACPQEAIALTRKPQEAKPPADREALHEIIRAKRKGPLGKAKLSGKLALDMLRTGNYALLR